ncbi:CoA transferase [Saccharopolyspora sp. K220]|uniref:CaiB/BaiF CoA transferase family protein n=1 Tax=Saccharopolyspora soli TaxID=2926618 RepID=UPI001F5A0B50|nr:CoA transferase [Saccharopolyspora soli]MCI2420824.1 CoA transferase [Saccharopolyspora soli]
MSTQGPLSGIRVLELGNYIAAPTTGRLLADFGAEVIKVERPGTGDELRSWRLFRGETSMLWRTMNRNKKCITLDLRSDEGRAIALDLVRRSDVVIENFRPGTLEKWGLGPDQLTEARPDLVLVRVSAYGQTGPYRDRPGFGAVAEAIGGLRLLTGDPDRPPARVGISIGDTVAGLYATIGVLMSLLRRERGEHQPGKVVDVALYEAVFSMMESLLPDYEAYGVLRERTGGRMEGLAPTNTYRCRDDKWVVIAGNGDAIYRRLMTVLDRTDLRDDPGLATNPGRWQRRDELDAAISAWTGDREIDEVLRLLDEAGVPAGPIYDAADISKDPHFLARGMLRRREVRDGDEDFGPVAFPGVVPRLGSEPEEIRWLGPELGAHNDEVLGSLLGLDENARRELHEKQVI